MILIIVGTHYQPFERLIKAGDEYASQTKEKVVIQCGVSNYQCKFAKHFKFCQKEEMKKLINEAEVIVMQGGWGAIREAIDMGKRVIAVPRIEGVEHVHNQEQIVRKLESQGNILAVYDIKELPKIIKKSKTFMFKPLEHGNADIIKKALDLWFSKE